MRIFSILSQLNVRITFFLGLIISDSMNTLYLFLSINLLTYTWVIYFDSSDNMDVERMEMNIVNFSFMELILGKGALEILGHHSFD